MSRERVAVIGAGVSGLTAAHLLQRRYDVVLFEARHRLGGHAHTHDVVAEDGRDVAVDSGFLVHNERTYPRLLRLFGELGVRTQDTEMSMSLRCLGCGLEYAGAKRLRGLFAQPANLTRLPYLRLLAHVRRFHRAAQRLLASEQTGSTTTFGEFLATGRYPRYFVEHFALPLVSAVWSASGEMSRRYPARYLFEFLNQHGMLSVGGSPVWRTVVGGSREYVRRVADRLWAVRGGTPIREVRATAKGITVRDEADVVHHVDRAVIATHADEALAMLAEPTARQQRVLGAFDYSTNQTWLHTDPNPLPRSQHARAAWNYLKPSCTAGPDRVLVSYDVNRLMRLVEPADYVVTLNAAEHVDRATVLAAMTYRHPIYTPESVAVQPELATLGDDRLAFAGAYHGWGFHEDGCASGARAASAFGVGW